MTYDEAYLMNFEMLGIIINSVSSTKKVFMSGFGRRLYIFNVALYLQREKLSYEIKLGVHLPLCRLLL